jgi:hypothetical protein
MATQSRIESYGANGMLTNRGGVNGGGHEPCQLIHAHGTWSTVTMDYGP